MTANKTVLITGTSSGIGKAAVKLFQASGWNVVATMRTPEKETELQQLDRVLVTALDVTKQESIEEAIAKGIAKFGTIDVLINNAGFGMMGLIEASSEELMQRIFDVNVFGVVRTTKAILPHFRARGEGLIVNVSSMVGRACFPFQALYHATKHALEGFTEDSQYELNPLGIRVKLVEPGGVATDFLTSLEQTGDGGIADYNDSLEKYFLAVQAYAEKLSTPEQIAQVVFEAATDNSDQLRYWAGEDAKQLLAARKAMNDRDFYQMIAEQFGVQ